MDRVFDSTQKIFLEYVHFPINVIILIKFTTFRLIIDLNFVIHSNDEF